MVWRQFQLARILARVCISKTHSEKKTFYEEIISHIRAQFTVWLTDVQYCGNAYQLASDSTHSFHCLNLLFLLHLFSQLQTYKNSSVQYNQNNFDFYTTAGM